METPILARYRLTVDRMIEGQRVHRRLTRGKFTRLWMFASECFAGVVFTKLSWDLQAHPEALVFFVLSVLVVLAGFAVVHLLVTDRCYGALIGWGLSMRSTAAKEVEWSFFGDRLERRGQGVTVPLRWEKLWKVAELPTGFLIHRGGMLWDWVSLDSFASPEAAREFSRLAAVHAKRYVLLENEGQPADG